MPMIQVKIAIPHPATPAAAAAKRQVAALTGRLSADILRKDPAVTAILVEALAPEDWTCGGRTLAELGKAAFWLDIRVTDGTNTKDEVASFVAAVFSGIAELLGPLHEESYVHVFGVRADSYGYGGLTQERRYIAARPAPRAA